MTGHRKVRQRKTANHRPSTGGRSAAGSGGQLSKIVVLIGTVLLSLALYGQTATPSAPAGNINRSTPLKLPVAHAHFGSLCMGYLTIAPEGIRYDAVRGKDQHSFAIKREHVVFLNYWFLSGQKLNAVEIRTATKNYHFWLMRSFEDLQSANWKPVQAANSDILLLSLYYWGVTGNVPKLVAVKAAIRQARAQAANAAMAQATPSGNGPASNDPYERMSQHMYANTNSQTSVMNQMNSINHMSHW